ncbi:MAG: PHP domain-containing protein [Candidatus Omnitrophica bacterium]|nr:PHP domain-containing protein [Candidatus Omnitrophota bacterium]
MKFADLHIHTYFSDGTDSVGSLIKQIKPLGLTCVSITDHDNVDALEEALVLFEKENIELIPGIELTAEYNQQEVHILGYFIDHKDRTLIDKLNFLKNNRRERVRKMIEKLNRLGVDISVENVLNIAGKATIGRLHLAYALVKEKKVSSVSEAFRKYIGEEAPAYVLGFRFNLQEGIELVKKCGGIPVLAHPYSIKENSLYKIIESGVEGIEVYYPEHTPYLVNYYLSLAQKYNLLVTGGSDFHGELKPDTKLGLIKIPYELVKNLKDAKDKR